MAALLIKRFEPKVLLTWTCGLSSVLTILSYQMAELGGWQVSPSIVDGEERETN